jgi:phosphate uptake regulator
VGIVVELRKLQVVGSASFSVTLPPDWIKENKLKPSDQISITKEDDGSLRLLPGIIHEEEKEVKIKIDADRCKDPGLLKRLIIGGYNRGCDSIEIVSKHTISENHRREINDATDGLMGMGIVESTSNRVMLQSVIDPSKFPFRPLLKRLYELVSSMYGDALQALNDKNPSLATNVIQRENEVDRIYWLAGRQIAAAAYDKTVLKKIDLKGVPDLALHIAILPRIWSVTNYAVDIANNQLALGKNVVNDADLRKVVQLGKMSHEIFSNACEAFFKEDIVLANRTVEALSPFEEMREELITNFGPRIFKDGQVGLHLINIIRGLNRIARYGKFIAEITIDYSTAEKSNLP